MKQEILLQFCSTIVLIDSFIVRVIVGLKGILMDPISHIAFVYILGLRNISVLSILGAVAPDIDKIFTYAHRKFRGHESRTIVHELPLAALFVSISILINSELCLGLISHYVLDFILGESRPFYPFFGNIVDFNLEWKYKIGIGATLWLTGGLIAII